MKKILYVSAAVAALAFAGSASAAGKGGGGGHMGGSAHIGGAAHVGVGMGSTHGVGAAVSGAAKTHGGAAAVLPNTRASDEGIEYGSEAKTKAHASTGDDDGDGVMNRDDTDDDNDGVLDTDDGDSTHANNGVGAAVSAAARSGGGAAAVLPNTRASANGIEYGSMSATHHGTDASATVKGHGKAKGRIDTDSDGIPDNRDPDANNNGVLDINE